MEPKRTEPAKADKPELRPDGEDRFEKAIDIAIKTPAIRKGKPSIVKRKP
jgi:hypothetical protein